MPKYKIEVTAYPSIITVEADNIDEAEEMAQELWETEPTHREVDGVHVLEIDGVAFDGFADEKLKDRIELAKTFGDLFKVVYWHSPEDRDQGFSETEKSGLSFEEAYALYLDIRCKHASTEIQVDNDDFTEAILYHGPDEKERCIVEIWQIGGGVV